jgi:large subunit ribosomal protein L23
MNQVFPEEKLMKILLAPRITEKSAFIGMHRQYVFKVHNDATKPEVKRAVEYLFDVKVEAVQISLVNSKVKRFGKIEGRRKGWKKAYVKLAEGYKIEFETA